MGPSAGATALGESRWMEAGGTVTRCTHPSGRITVTYVSPTGEKFRSWKQCLGYMGEEEISPLKQELKKSSSAKEFSKVGVISHPSSSPEGKRKESASKKSRKGDGVPLSVISLNDGSREGSKEATRTKQASLPLSSYECEEEVGGVPRTNGIEVKSAKGKVSIPEKVSAEIDRNSSVNEIRAEPEASPTMRGKSKSNLVRVIVKDDDDESKHVPPKGKSKTSEKPTKVVQPVKNTPEAGRKRNHETSVEAGDVPQDSVPESKISSAQRAGRLRKVVVSESSSEDGGDLDFGKHKQQSKASKDSPASQSNAVHSESSSGEVAAVEFSKRYSRSLKSKPPAETNLPKKTKQKTPSERVSRKSKKPGGSETVPPKSKQTEEPSKTIASKSEKPNVSVQTETPNASPEVAQERVKDVHTNGHPRGKAKRSAEVVSDSSGSDSDESKEKKSLKPSSRPQRAAAGTCFKEKRIRLNEEDGRLEVRKDREADSEEVAVMLTGDPSEGCGPDQPPQRRLLDFILHDENGKHQPIENLEMLSLFITGMFLPSKGVLDKERGVRCQGVGPITSWSIMGYEKGIPVLVFTTDIAEYYCEKPAGIYKKMFNVLFDKARLCVEAYKSLSRPEGGDPHLHLDELIARVSRSFSRQGADAHFYSREYFVNHGAFVVSQLTALDALAEESDQLFSGLPALESLEKEAIKRTASLLKSRVASNYGTLKINEGGSGGTAAGTDSMAEDEKLARLLQDEEDGDYVASGPARRAPSAKGKFYVKINETEIANDYPLPAYYKPEVDETDEYLLFDDEVADPDREDFPHRKLQDWTLYNSDARLMSLELLPMLRGAETDMEIFGSGVITEDDGTGFSLDDDATGAGSLAISASSERVGEQGIRVYLSAVKEWKIEFGSSFLIISFRTDGAWYRLGEPSQQYVNWYKPVLKTARIAVKIITMLKEELRVSRLSFNDVVKKLSEQGKSETTYISSRPAEVERYVIVHGQIILQQFAEYPDPLIQKCAFITGLATKMEQISHTKLTLSKKRVLVKKGRNLNPRANLCPDSAKRKPMRATTTHLVNRIWSTYYATADESGQTTPEDAGKDAEVVEEEVVEESDDEEVFFETKSTPIIAQKKTSWKASGEEVKWGEKSSTKTLNKEQVFRKAVINGVELTAGKAVLVDLDEGSVAPSSILLIEYLYETKRAVAMLHGRVLLRGTDTVLGNASNDREVFLTDSCEDVEIEKIQGPITVEMRQRNWGHMFRKENSLKDDADRALAKERENNGLPKEYFCRFWYRPESGGFFILPVDSLAVGNGGCKACQTKREVEERLEVRMFPEEDGFRFQGVEYHINDYLYVDPDVFKPSSLSPAAPVLYKGGRNKGLHAFAVCQLLSVLPAQSKSLKKTSCLMKVRRFYRPEDVDKLKAYKAQIHEIYYGEETSIVDITAVRGRCEVRRKVEVLDTFSEGVFNHIFSCSYIHDPKKGTVKQLPAGIKLGSSSHYGEDEREKSQANDVAAKAKGKGKVIESEQILEHKVVPDSSAVLSTLDIFSGCGGLSEGLHQSGVSTTKWAIEYDHPAAEAFKLNHPTAEVFCENCNVVLRSIMERGGDLDDCVSTPEAEEMCAQLGEERRSKLPKPGEVDFINGGPPCQGFSGMNRFNQRAWSKVQCEMILAFLSYADYFRPRYFLLENVRNFISFNKGQTFRLSLASLLEMGYQVRFGVLQAGNYGVAQSRKRAFIWAAGPEEILPEWPEPMHVFATSQLGISLPGNFQYAAVKDAARGAPFRSITVRDTIGELPAVENGAAKGETPYTSPPESWFQMNIRGKETILSDHISKEMNELNLIRCQRIPKEPGSDWRNLPEEKVKLSTGQLVDLIPWCLPNTAARHNQWKGLFGRLDWDGNFPTSITDPQPMGKVGMCFHPEQDRIVTVRECARSQGFPDSYKFYGNINSKHRQIGNAVPPPLACALGHSLKAALHSRKKT